MNGVAWAIISGFVGGALITIIATLLIVKWQRQRKELSYRIDVRPFIATEEPGRPGARWDANVRIFYGDKEVSQLFPFKVTFRNTGNQTLEDLQIRLRPNVPAEILNLIVGHAGGVEVGYIKYVAETPDNREFKCGFLNEGDEIRVYGIGTTKGANSDVFRLTVTVPQPGVKCRNRPEFWSTGEAFRKVLEIVMRGMSFSV